MVDLEGWRDVECERLVTGDVLLHPESLQAYRSAGLTVECFMDGDLREIWRAIGELEAQGVTPDWTSIRTAIRKRDVPASFFAGLLEGIPRQGPENIQHHVNRLDTLSRCRTFALGEMRLRQQLLTNPALINNGIITSRIDELRGLHDKPGQTTDFLSLDEQLKAHAEAIAREDVATVRTGYQTLDELTGGGVRPGEVLDIMARPGTGKTNVLINIADYLGHTDPGLTQLIFSLEMPVAQWIERQMRVALKLGRHRLRELVESGALDLDAYRQRFAKQLITDRPGLSLRQISDMVGRVKDQLGDDGRLVAMVDHFGLLGGDRGLSSYERVSTQAREMKELAKRWNVPVLVAIQVSRDAGGDGSKELHLGAARDSGVIEEAADYLVALRQPGRETGLSAREVSNLRGRVMMKLVKNRHGELGHEFPLELDPISLRLYEVAP